MVTRFAFLATARSAALSRIGTLVVALAAGALGACSSDPRQDFPDGSSGGTGARAGSAAGGTAGSAGSAAGSGPRAGASGMGGTAGAAGAGGASAGSGGQTADLPWLHVEGNKIKDPNGATVILRGVSLIDLGALEGWEGGIHRMIDRLTDANDAQGSSTGWHTKVIRLAVVPRDGDTQTPYQYQEGSSTYYETILRPAVDYVRSKGAYAIIDWHYIDDTTLHRETTAAFWSDMAPRFANDAHVMFELYNEPINAGNWLEVREDMQDWYDIVRASAPRNLVLVGTPNWCQIVGPAATQPLTGENIVYVAHMYPQHWVNPSLQTQISTAAAVHPVFLTEWGFQDGSNAILNGTISSYGAPFKQFVEQQKLSWTAWCASSTWGPPMFDAQYRLRVGEGEMGGFTKDWLYEKRDSDQPTP
jgi:hypothetical protein